MDNGILDRFGFFLGFRRGYRHRGIKEEEIGHQSGIESIVSGVAFYVTLAEFGANGVPRVRAHEVGMILYSVTSTSTGDAPLIG